MKRDPLQVAKALRDVGLYWTVYNNGMHWKVKSLGLDIWPTRWKTMHARKVSVWNDMGSFKLWLERLKRGQSGDLPASAKPVPRRHVRRAKAKEAVRVRPEHFNEADWEGFRQSGLMPW